MNIWLEIAVAYYRQGCKEGFRDLLRDIIGALDERTIKEYYDHDPEAFKVLELQRSKHCVVVSTQLIPA
jgi:hypothetical protein